MNIKYYPPAIIRNGNKFSPIREPRNTKNWTFMAYEPTYKSIPIVGASITSQRQMVFSMTSRMFGMIIKNNFPNNYLSNSNFKLWCFYTMRFWQSQQWTTGHVIIFICSRRGKTGKNTWEVPRKQEQNQRAKPQEDIISSLAAETQIGDINIIRHRGTDAI